MDQLLRIRRSCRRPLPHILHQTITSRAHRRLQQHTLRRTIFENTINNVVATFRSEGRPNPTRDSDGQIAWILSRQYRAYKNHDPKEKHEKALPSCILTRIALNQTSETRQAISQLIIGAFFFACRSCEYLKVSKPLDKRTNNSPSETSLSSRTGKLYTTSHMHPFSATQTACPSPSKPRKTNKNLTPSLNGGLPTTSCVP